MLNHRYCLRSTFIYACVLLLLLLFVPVQGASDIPRGRTQRETRLYVTNNLACEEKELIVETDEWKVIFSLFYNGGIYRMFDKVYDSNEQDNLVTGPWYCQGGIFDYDVYLVGNQEFSTALGRNNEPGRATLEIIENTPVRLRIRQKCRPRLNNGDGPPNDQFVELDMVETTTEWTFYPTGRVNIKFDALTAEDWDGICSQGPGGAGKGINANGRTVTATNGTDFLVPWVTRGDTIESAAGGWGPIQIAERIDRYTLRLASAVASGTNLDFIIYRPNIIDETISIHADGDPGNAPRISYWQGGSNGDHLFDNGTDGDMFRNATPPLEDDYAFVHWTRPPREFGSLLAFYEPFEGATYAVFNDLSWGDISYTQVARRGLRPFEEHHRHFMAHLGTENGQFLPRIKSVTDALPYADDYRNPYACARAGQLRTGDGISVYGYHVPSGAYHIAADENKTAEIVFDAWRGGCVESPLPYQQPAILVSGLDVADAELRVEFSQNDGATFEELPRSLYNMTTRAESSELGACDRRLLQLLCKVPPTARDRHLWTLRLRAESPE
ncbi:MAG: hypothetical protein PVH77_01710 [Phycisphaerales bacterium]